MSSTTQQHASRTTQRKHPLQHEHRAINTEVGGFTSCPAISPSTVRANRNNHSFRSSITVPLQFHLHFGTFFSTTRVLTKYRNTLLHVKGRVSNHSQKESLPATHQKLVFCDTHGKPLGSGESKSTEGFNKLHPSQHNSSTHHPNPLPSAH